MQLMPIVERCAILTENEGWFGRAAPEFQQAVLSRCVWRDISAGQHIYRARIGRITWLLPDCSWYGRRGQGSSIFQSINESGEAVSVSRLRGPVA